MQGTNNKAKAQNINIPISTNFKRLGAYLPHLKLNQIIVLEWLIISAETFKFKPFFHSIKDISDKVHIGEKAVRNALDYWSNTDFYFSEGKGMRHLVELFLMFDKSNNSYPIIEKFDYSPSLS